MSTSANDLMLHATAVAWGEKGVLLCGKSGSGKSALGMELLGLGCQLIADDQVCLRRDADDIIASCPPAISGLIEVRGIGLVNAIPAPPTPVAIVVDLETDEDTRMPPTRTIPKLGIALPLINRIRGTHFAAAILQVLKQGKADHD